MHMYVFSIFPSDLGISELFIAITIILLMYMYAYLFLYKFSQSNVGIDELLFSITIR